MLDKTLTTVGAVKVLAVSQCNYRFSFVVLGYSLRKPILKFSRAACYSHVPYFCFLHVIMKRKKKIIKKI